MLRKGHIFVILLVCVSTITAFTVLASAEESLVPSWIKTTVSFWVNGDSSDQEFLNAITWMLKNNVLQVSSQDDDLREEVDKLYQENQRLQEEIDELYQNYVYDLNDSYYDEPTILPEDYCFGKAACFFGIVTRIVDGDTIQVDGQSIRFALVNTPEYGDDGYTEARNFIESVCPVGSPVLVDQDDGQTQGSYNRMIAVIYCNDTSFNLNEAVLDAGLAEIDTRFCRDSEFGFHYWALIYGCSAEKSPQPELEPSCDPSYPDFCIPSPPPDLNCIDISQKRFTVIGSDPHRFDGDDDGIGCES